ncbi:hypothetical protein ACLBW2_06805 [Enterobacteriaceae bacterium C23F]
MKKNHFYLSVTGALVVIILLISGYWIGQHNLNFTCSSSTVSFATNVNNKLLFNFTQTLSFSYSGKFVMHISGGFQDGDREYVLNRTIVSDYKRSSMSEYNMKVVNVTRAGSDNVPDNLEHQYLMPIVLGSQRIMAIRQLPSGSMVISNPAGPYVICAVH